MYKVNLLIHKLNLPVEIRNQIAKYAITLLDCKVCKKAIVKDSTRSENVGWYIGSDEILCILCSNEKYSRKRIKNQKKNS
jgi:hypothetical protein